MRLNKAFTLTLVAILFSSFCFISNPVSASNQTGTISADTIWTKQDSPYTVSGQVTVNDGVTLTIEAGVTVNICGTLQVNGAIVAKGTDESKIDFNGGNIILSPNSATAKQRIILENCLISGSAVSVSGDVTISHSSTGTITVAGGNPTISNCSVTGLQYPFAIHIAGGSPTIINSTLIGGITSESTSKQPIISYNNILGPVQIQGGTPVITHNMITGINRGYVNDDSNGTVQAGAGSELSGGIGLTGYNYGDEKLYNAVITDNVIVGGLDGICWNAGPSAVIKNNYISNFTRTGLALGSNAVVCNNSIVNNKVGLNIFNFNGDYMGNEGAQNSPTLNYNNIMNNEYNIYSYCGRSLDATSNWWGTTDVAAIRETIYDHTFDQNLGTFTIMPVLTAANALAYPSDVNTESVNPPAATATPTPASSLTPPATSITTVAPATNSSFKVESNSTVSALYFNAASKELTFTVNGTTGTTGYLKITIDKDFIPKGDGIKVYLDDNQIQYNLSQTDNSWIIMFTYHHSQHQVRIAETVQDQTQATAWVPAAVVVAIIALVSSLSVAGLWYTRKSSNKPT